MQFFSMWSERFAIGAVFLHVNISSAMLWMIWSRKFAQSRPWKRPGTDDLHKTYCQNSCPLGLGALSTYDLNLWSYTGTSQWHAPGRWHDFQMFWPRNKGMLQWNPDHSSFLVLVLNAVSPFWKKAPYLSLRWVRIYESITAVLKTIKAVWIHL